MFKFLILGGARSGKSAYAEELAIKTGKTVIYIATATASDDEMQKRIQHHRSRRPSDWTVIEEPLQLAETIRKTSGDDNIILVDCLTLWMTNLLSLDKPQRHEHINELLNVIAELDSDIIMVSNEVGMGIIPLGELTREFCDETGRLHQQLAQSCEQLVLMVAGLPMYVKGEEA